MPAVIEQIQTDANERLYSCLQLIAGTIERKCSNVKGIYIRAQSALNLHAVQRGPWLRGTELGDMCLHDAQAREPPLDSYTC